jgi:hypothetical protein
MRKSFSILRPKMHRFWCVDEPVSSTKTRKTNQQTSRRNQMKVNQWTLGLAAAGVVSFGSVMQAEEGKQSPVMSALSPTVLSGYVNTSAIWNLGTGRAVVGRPFTTTEKQDGFNLDVVKVALEKPLSEDQWAAGYKVELLFGRDAQLYGTSFDTWRFALRWATASTSRWAFLTPSSVMKALMLVPIRTTAATTLTTSSPLRTRAFWPAIASMT